MQCRFRAPRLALIQPRKIEDTAIAGVSLDCLKCFQLRHVDGDGELAATTMGDAVHLTIAIQKLLAGNAQRGLERCGRVVNAGMNHLAVARTGVHAELPLALGDDHFPAAASQCPGDRQADDAGADHHALRLAQRRSTALAAAMNSSTSAPAVA